MKTSNEVTKMHIIFSQFQSSWINLAKSSLRSIDKSIDLGFVLRNSIALRHSSNERNAKCNLNPGVKEKKEKEKKEKRAEE